MGSARERRITTTYDMSNVKSRRWTEMEYTLAGPPYETLPASVPARQVRPHKQSSSLNLRKLFTRFSTICKSHQCHDPNQLIRSRTLPDSLDASSTRGLVSASSASSLSASSFNPRMEEQSGANTVSEIRPPRSSIGPSRLPIPTFIPLKSCSSDSSLDSHNSRTGDCHAPLKHPGYHDPVNIEKEWRMTALGMKSGLARACLLQAECRAIKDPMDDCNCQSPRERKHVLT